MIPNENLDHVVLRTRLDPINDLLSAMQDAAILPKRIPKHGGFEEIEQDIDRFDIKFILRYRVFLDNITIDAYHDIDAPGENVLRLGLPIRQIAASLSMKEISTGNTLSSFEYAISGRLFIYGSVESDPNTKAPFFVISQLPKVVLDDHSDRIPPLFPIEDMEKLVSRSMNRNIRAQTSTALPSVRFPISVEVHDLLKDVSTSYGLRFADPLTKVDELSKPICLPPGFGTASCIDNQLPISRNFFTYMDHFLRVNTSTDPVNPARFDRALRIDVGKNIINRELQKNNSPGEWKEVAAKFFRFKVGSHIEWRSHSDKGSIFAGGDAELQVAYPKIKWCTGWTKLPFGGRISYKYPCGIERGWHGVQEDHGIVEVSMKMENGKACLYFLQNKVDGSSNVFGYLLSMLYVGVAGSIVVGIVSIFSQIAAGALAVALVKCTFLIFLLLAVIDDILDAILNFLPDHYCADLTKYLTLPIMGDKIDIEMNNSLVEFDPNGIILQVDPDFEKRN